VGSLTLRIADLDVSVCLQRTGQTVEPSLRDFSARDPSSATHLTLILKPGLPPLPELIDPLESARVRGARTPDGFWFDRSPGAMCASEDFSACRSWTGRPAGIPPRFNGRPWLMFALWGYFAQRGGVFLHGATCVLDGRYVLLLGDSQVGKSTLARLAVDAGYTSLTDEYPAVTLASSGPRAHGLPWPGRNGPPAPASGDLAAIFFLRQAPDNTLERLAPPETARRLVGNIRFFGWDPATTLPTFDTLDQIARSVPAYEASFAPSPDAVDMLVQAL